MTPKAVGRIVVMFALFALGLPCYAPAYAKGPAQAITTDIESAYSKVDDLSADFRQEAYSVVLKRSVESSGKVYFKKPGKMRWDYDKPKGDAIVSNGVKLWLYQADLKQVIETRQTKSLATDLLAGKAGSLKGFAIEVEKETADTITLGLMPIEPLPSVNDITIEVDKKTHLVTKTVIVDGFGAKTTVTFDNIKLNSAIEDKFFEFKAPAGTNVFRR